MSEVSVTATENGPYVVEGPVELVDPAGNPIRAPQGAILLCRCGGSCNKPFCDSATDDIPPNCTRQDGGLAV